MKTCYKTEIAGYPIKIEQQTKKRFAVHYGSQVREGLDYVSAAKEFGLCMFHALACEGRLDNDDMLD